MALHVVVADATACCCYHCYLGDASHHYSSDHRDVKARTPVLLQFYLQLDASSEPQGSRRAGREPSRRRGLLSIISDWSGEPVWPGQWGSVKRRSLKHEPRFCWEYGLKDVKLSSKMSK